MKFPIYLALMKADGKYYIYANKPGVVSAFVSEREALNFFENAYRRGHNRSFEGSMSACMNWMSFQPSVVSLNSDEEFYNLFGGKQARFVEIRNVAGGFCGAIPEMDLTEMFENGTKPSLIKDEWLA